MFAYLLLSYPWCVCQFVGVIPFVRPYLRSDVCQFGGVIPFVRPYLRSDVCQFGGVIPFVRPYLRSDVCQFGIVSYPLYARTCVRMFVNGDPFTGRFWCASDMTLCHITCTLVPAFGCTNIPPWDMTGSPNIVVSYLWGVCLYARTWVRVNK